MNLKNMILSTIILSIGFLPSCSSPNETPPCDSGSNNNIVHKCLNANLDYRGNKGVDITGDGIADLAFALDKEVVNGTVVNSIGYLPIIHAQQGWGGSFRYDYYVERKKLYADSNYVPIRVYEGFDVDSSIHNWLLRLTLNEPNVVTHTHGDLSPIGSSIKYTGGLIDIGDFYIAFRFYDKEGTNGPSGWKNGWMKLNITKDRILLMELAYNKQPETKIKVGAK